MKTRNKAIPDSNETISTLKETYLHWTAQQLKTLHSHLDILEREDLNRSDNLVTEIFNIAYNIKGPGGSFGYYLMSDIASSLCDYIHNMDKISDVQTDIIIAHAKAMDLVISQEIKGSGGARGAKITTYLQKMVEEDGNP